MTIYYVSKNGNDSATGKSVLSAWASIDRVNSHTFSPSDKILFEGGSTFTGNIYIPVSGITLGSYGGSRAVIQAGDSYGVLVYNVGNWTITNLEFVGSENNADAGVQIFNDTGEEVVGIIVNQVKCTGFYLGIAIGGDVYRKVRLTRCVANNNVGGGIWLYGPTDRRIHSDVIFSLCEAYDNPGTIGDNAWASGFGIAIYSANKATITGCLAHDNGRDSNGTVGIYFAYSDNCKVQKCEVYKTFDKSGNDGDGISLDEGTSNSFIQYCYTHDNDGCGLMVSSGDEFVPNDNNTVRFNISENDGRVNWQGMGIFGKAANTKFYNNTIYFSATANQLGNSAACGFSPGWEGDNLFVANNIFLVEGDIPLVTGESSNKVTFLNNCYFSSTKFTIFYNSVEYHDLSSWQNVQEDNNGSKLGLDSDPFLTNVGSGGTIGKVGQISKLQAYRLEPYSPCLGRDLDLSQFGINKGTSNFFGFIGTKNIGAS